MNDMPQDIEYRRAYGSATIKYDLALTLEGARREAGLSQQQIAKLCGVSQPYIARLERGEANPTIGNIGGLLAVAYGLRLQFRLEPLITPTVE